MRKLTGCTDELPLTLYDVYRKPRAVREDDAELELAADTVYNEFKCPSKWNVQFHIAHMTLLQLSCCLTLTSACFCCSLLGHPQAYCDGDGCKQHAGLIRLASVLTSNLCGISVYASIL